MFGMGLGWREEGYVRGFKILGDRGMSDIGGHREVLPGAERGRFVEVG